MGNVQKLLRALGLRRPQPVVLPVTFYTRQGCHLCDEALKLLHDLVAQTAHLSLDLAEVDIDPAAELVARYGDKVPVLVIAGRERLWGKINPVLLRRTLEAEAAQMLRERLASGG